MSTSPADSNTTDIDEHVRRIPLVTAVNPDTQAYFKEIAASKKAVRAGRANIDVSCAQCVRLAKEADLLRCSRCKVVWYCSKECQKQHWPTHKKACKDSPSSTPKMISSFMANPVLHHHLQLLLILAYNLHQTPLPDTPFRAQCDVAIELADMSYIMQLVLGRLSQEEQAKGAEGMLQVKAFEPVPLEPGAEVVLDATRMEIWKNAKKGHPRASVGVVDFKMKGMEQTLPFGVLISEDALARTRAGAGFEMHSSMLDKPKRVPLSKSGCFDFINMHIRSDKRNQLRLRTHLTKEDIDKMRGLDENEGDD